MVSFPQVSPLEPSAHLFPPPYAPLASPISFFSMTVLTFELYYGLFTNRSFSVAKINS